MGKGKSRIKKDKKVKIAATAAVDKKAKIGSPVIRFISMLSIISVSVLSPLRE